MATRNSPVLPPYIPPRVQLNRPSATEVNRTENTKQTLTYSGYNEVVPIVYGEQIVGGPIIAGPVISANKRFTFAVAVCYGGTEGIERFEHITLNDMTFPLPAITSPNSGTETSPNVYTIVRIYDGRQTAPDALLVSLIDNFNDVFPGVAYAVIQTRQSDELFSPAATVEIRIKGRKCFDPRDDTTAWTENPSLHLRDFVTNTVFGLGRNIVGINAAADINDEEWTFEPRARSGY